MSSAWEAVHQWLPLAGYEQFLMRASETGNGTDYVGTSPYSDLYSYSPRKPLISVIDDFFTQTSQSPDDTGGTLKWNMSTDGGLTYFQVGIDDWSNIKTWGSTAPGAGYYYYGTETGNGTDFIGQSPWSDIYYVP
jgi:hypothetical protein